MDVRTYIYSWNHQTVIVPTPLPPTSNPVYIKRWTWLVIVQYYSTCTQTSSQEKYQTYFCVHWNRVLLSLTKIDKPCTQAFSEHAYTCYILKYIPCKDGSQSRDVPLWRIETNNQNSLKWLESKLQNRVCSTTWTCWYIIIHCHAKSPAMQCSALHIHNTLH